MSEKKYYIAQACDTKTGNMRIIGVLATRPLLDFGPEVAKVADTMLDEFINEQRATDNIWDTYHFVQWCFYQNKYGKKKSLIKAGVDLVDEAEFNKFKSLSKDDLITAMHERA